MLHCASKARLGLLVRAARPVAHRKPPLRALAPLRRASTSPGSGGDGGGDGESGARVVVRSAGIGAAAGGFGALVGLGGGFIALPLLTSVGKLTQHQAHATSLCSVLAAATAACFGYVMGGFVNLPSAAIITTTATVTAGLGARMAKHRDPATLKRMLAWLMVVAAPLIPLREALKSQAPPQQQQQGGGGGGGGGGGQEQASSSAVWQWPSVGDGVRLGCVGLASGFLAGTFGVGGGIVMVPAMVLTTDFEYLQAVGTSMAAMVLPTLTATLTHARSGHVVWRVGIPMAVGSSVGALVSARWVAQRVDQDKLRWLFVALLLGMGGRTLLGPR